MARELQELSMGSLAGVRHRGSKLTVPEANSVDGSKNWYFAAPDEVTGIEGYSLLTNAQTSRVRELIWFLWMDDAGVPNSELLAVAGTQLWSIDPDTGDYTLIGGTFSEGVFPDQISWAEIQDKLYIASGDVAPVHVYDPALGTCVPILNELPAIPTIVAGAAGDPSGLYHVRYRAVRDDGTVDYASPPETISVELLTFVVTIPVPVDPAGIAGHEIYVRPPGPIGTASPEYYYRAGYLDIATAPQEFTYDLTDGALRLNPELEKYGDPPPLGGRYLTHALNRLWVMGWNGEDATVALSDANEPSSFSSLTQFRVNPGDSDIPTAIVAGVNRPGETSRNLLATVFKRRGIYNLLDTGETLGATGRTLLVQIEKTRSRVGAVSENSIIQAPIGGQDAYLFLAADGTIRAFTGEDSEDISEPVRDYLNDLNYGFARRSFGYWLPRRKMVIWHYPRGQSQWPDFALGYHLETNNWVVFPDYPPLAAALAYRDEVNLERYYMSGAIADGGQFDLYRQFVGYSFGGDPITWIWRSKPLLTDTGDTFTFEYIEPICIEGEGSPTFEVKAWRGFEDPDLVVPWMDSFVTLDRPGQEYVHPIIPLQNDDGDLMVDQEITLQFGETSITQKATMVGFRMGFRKKRRKRFDQPEVSVLS